MNQNKILVVVVLVFAAAAFIGGYLWKGGGSAATPTPTLTPTPVVSSAVTPTATPVPSVSYKPILHTVRMLSSGLSPQTLRIRPGDAVRILNETVTAFWPASDPHPSHTGCAGFDAGRGLQNGEAYTLTFSALKTCTYHDHLDSRNVARQGTIIIQ